MKSTELTKKKDADLQKLLIEKKEALREYSFGMAGAAKSGVSPQAIRKDVARILTELNARKAHVSKTDNPK